MPSIPVYNSQKNIQARTPEPLRNEAAKEYEPLNQITEALQKTAEAWQKADDVMKRNMAIANHEIEKQKAIEESALDTGISKDANGNLIFTDNSESYLPRLDKAKEEALKGVTNKAEQQALQAQFDMENAITSATIKSQFRKKQLEFNKGKLSETLQAKYSSIAYSQTGEQKAQILESINQTMEDNVISGVITPDEATILKRKSAKQVASNIIATAPEEGIALIDEMGIPLSASDRKQLKNDARLLAKRNKEIAKMQEDMDNKQAILDMSKAMAAQQLTVEIVESSSASDSVKAIFHSIATGKIPDYPENTTSRDADYFLDLLQSASGDNAQVDKILEKVAKQYADNKIGSNQLAYFIGSMDGILADQKKQKYSASEQAKNVFNAVKGMVTAGGNMFVKSGVDTVKNVMLDRFFDMYTKDTNPQDVADKVVAMTASEENDYMNEYPQYDKDGEPKVYSFKSGQYVITGYDKNTGKPRFVKK